MAAHFKKLKKKQVLEEHIDLLDQDIKDIDDILDDVVIYDDTDEQVRETLNRLAEEETQRKAARKLARQRKKDRLAKEKKMEDIMTSLYGEIEKEEITELINDEQVPYKPNHKETDMHMSHMKEMMHEHVSMSDEDREFENLVKSQVTRRQSCYGILLDDDSNDALPGTNRRGSVHSVHRTSICTNSGRRVSILSSLFTNNEDEATVKPLNERKSSIFYDSVRSITRFFEQKIHPTDNNVSIKEQPEVPSDSNPISIENVGEKSLDITKCCLCGNKTCIFDGRSIYKLFKEHKESAHQVQQTSNPDVRDFLKKTLKENCSLTDFELINFSLSCE